VYTGLQELLPLGLACGRFESPAFTSRCTLGLARNSGITLHHGTNKGTSARLRAAFSAAARRLVFTGGDGVTKITDSGVAAHRRTYPVMCVIWIILFR